MTRRISQRFRERLKDEKFIESDKPAPRSTNPQQREHHRKRTTPASRSPSPNKRINPDHLPRMEQFGIEKKKKKLQTVQDTEGSSRPPDVLDQYITIDNGSVGPKHMRCSLNLFPTSASIVAKTKAPLGLIIQPLGPQDPDDEEVPLIDHGGQIMRCDECRAFINPFCEFLSGGGTWICSLCTANNNVPAWYYSAVNSDGFRDDADTRSEIKKGLVEYIAPPQYCSKKIKRVNFVFVVDTTPASLISGFACCALDSIALQLRTIFLEEEDSLETSMQIALITYDRKVLFHHRHQICVMSDVENPFLPIHQEQILSSIRPPEAENDPDELMDFIEYIEKLSAKLHEERNETTPAKPNEPCCFGAAAACGHQLLKDVGGKVVLFTNQHCTVGSGQLKVRSIQASKDTDETREPLRPAVGWYSELALAAIQDSVSFDIFCNAAKFIDLATISELPKLSGGSIFFYPSFNSETDGEALENDIFSCIARNQGVDCRCSLRCTKGVSVQKVNGGNLLDENLIMTYASMNESTAISINLQINETLPSRKSVIFQFTMLYTPIHEDTTLIRVLTLKLNTTRLMSEVFRCIDYYTCFSLTMRDCCSRIWSGIANTNLTKERKIIIETCIEVLWKYRRHCAYNSASGQLVLPEQLKHFPMLALGAAKSKLLDVRTTYDEKVNILFKMITAPLNTSIILLLPRLYELTNIRGTDDCTRNDTGVFQYPPFIPLARAVLEDQGLYLLQTDLEIILLIGDKLEEKLSDDLFEYDEFPYLLPPDEENETLSRIYLLLDVVRSNCTTHFLPLRIAPAPTKGKKKDLTTTKIYKYLIEEPSHKFIDKDRSKPETMGYTDFLVHLHKQIRTRLKK